MKLLLHTCCAPCSVMCIETLQQEEITPEIYWFNPNIHPFTEYRSRRNCLREYAAELALPYIERNDYALRPFIREVAPDIENRCLKCYEIRLGETARYAAENGYDGFTSTLFVSPYQQHEKMKEIASLAAEKFGVEFFYRDFRPYFKEGQEKAKEKGFYMQKYCGCVFSEEERYLKPKKIIR